MYENPNNGYRPENEGSTYHYGYRRADSGSAPQPERMKKSSTLPGGKLIALMLVCTAYLVDGSFNPFLYFRF